MQENKSHLTAITRKTASLPMKWLSSQDLLVPFMLDYGCGKGFDAEAFDMMKYDPHYTEGKIMYKDRVIINQKFKTITCNYVLNVIESQDEREAVLEHIRHLLHVDGKAYISIRRDPHVVEGYTSKGTYQSAVELDLPVVHEAKGKYIIYLLEK